MIICSQGYLYETLNIHFPPFQQQLYFYTDDTKCAVPIAWGKKDFELQPPESVCSFPPVYSHQQQFCQGHVTAQVESFLSLAGCESQVLKCCKHLASVLLGTTQIHFFHQVRNNQATDSGLDFHSCQRGRVRFSKIIFGDHHFLSLHH